MMSLFIDTSNFKLVIGVVDETAKIVKAYYNEILKGDLSSKIFDVLKKCIDESNIVPNDIEKIYVVTGPGSFTGVRIGVTIAKTYAWSLKKKVIPISSLEVLASTKCSTKYVVPMIDARRDAVYAGIYDNELNTKLSDTYIALEDLNNKLPDDYTIVSDDTIQNYNTIESEIDILKIVNKHMNDVGVNPHELKPNYLKLTEAEVNLKKRND